MSEHELFNAYTKLREATVLMVSAARKEDWPDFVSKEAASVALLETIEQSFSLDAITPGMKKRIISVVQEIIGMQSEINTLATAWRKTQVQKLQSDAMSAKLTSAYS